MTPSELESERQGLVAQLRAAGRPYCGGQANDSYTGSRHPFFNLSAPQIRAIARAWLAGHRRTPAADLVAVIDRLFSGEAYEEKVLAAVALGYATPARALVAPAMVDRWLDRLVGWAEIDSLCASVFGPSEMGGDWPAWRHRIAALARDANINKRRAALVLLTRPSRLSPDPRFRDLALSTIERLKGERAILIIKAVSWLLRSLTVHHASAVADFIEANAASLPAIAVRETRYKLATGTKSGRRGVLIAGVQRARAD